MDYSDLQVTTIIGTSRVTDNAADARIRGLEVETQFLPAEGLTTALSYAYTDAKYLDYVDGSGRDLSGNKLPGVSRHVINFRTVKSFAVGGGDLTISGGLTYRSKRPNESVHSTQVMLGAMTDRKVVSRK